MPEDLPFKEMRVGDLYVREFSDQTDPDEFKWHRDREDRIVEPLHETDWLFQFDDQLPIPIYPLYIPAGVWHRIIPGTGKLLVSVEKF